MRTLWRGIVNTIFWAYERGSWPYDVLVVVIVVFVLATPRSWFHDRPQQAVGASSSVQFVSQDAGSQTRIYRLDASALSPEKRTLRPTPELEREMHDLLGRTVDDLNDRPFTVLRIEPVLNENGKVLHYDVTVHL
jgi:hypothetical protein